MVQIPLRTGFSFRTFILLIWLFRVYTVSGCCFSHIIIIFSIYTLSDLGDLSNLIGSLSRTIQQYSPPSEWIMCELGVFPIFLENDLLKVNKILGLTFFKARKDFEGFKTAFFHLLLLSFVVDGLFTTPVYSPRRGRFVNSAFPNKKNLAQKRSLFMTNKFESKCLQKFYVSSKYEKECSMKTTSYLEEPNRHFWQHFMRRTQRHNKPFRL